MINKLNNEDLYNIRNKKLFLLDLDGTIYNENTLFEHVIDFLNYIKESNGKYIFLTNNSSKSVNDYVSKLKNMRIDVTEEDFFTSTQATIFYLKKFFNNKHIYCQGTKSFVDELINNGIDVTTNIDDNIATVVLGFDLELTSEKLKNTCYLLATRNIPFIATNPDIRCPVSFGYIPDCGSICQMIYNATGKKPYYIGKPRPDIINLVLDKYNYSKDQAILFGDRIYTDIMSGHNAGIDTVCVLSGECSINDINNSKIKPTYVCESIGDLYILLTSLI